MTKYLEKDDGVTYLNLDVTSMVSAARALAPTSRLPKLESELGFKWWSVRGVEKNLDIVDRETFKLLLSANQQKSNHFAHAYRAAGGRRHWQPSIGKVVEFLLWERSHTDLQTLRALEELDTTLTNLGSRPIMCINHKNPERQVLPQSQWYPGVIRNVLQTLGSNDTPSLHIPRMDDPDAWMSRIPTAPDVDTEELFDRVLNKSIR